MNPWEPYITNMKASGLQICGIYGLEGGAWAQSPEIKASQQEVAAIVLGIQSQNFPDGIHVSGLKYTLIRLEADTVTAKCKDAARDDQKYLLHAALAKTCITIGGICGPKERDTTKLVEDIRDHLMKSSY